jgi:hypothetical protein
MARITVTDDAGTVVISLDDDDIGNPDKPMGRAYLAGEIARAVATARTLDEAERERRAQLLALQSLVKDPAFGEQPSMGRFDPNAPPQEGGLED